jgi:hypothetical protein
MNRTIAGLLGTGSARGCQGTSGRANAQRRVQPTYNIVRQRADSDGPSGSAEDQGHRKPATGLPRSEHQGLLVEMVVRGGVEPPTFRFSGWQTRDPTMQSLPLRAGTAPGETKLSHLAT